jgi:MFS transporter, AAHS family, benzoate transport protein
MHDTNLQHLVDHAPLGRFHWRLLAWCALMIVCDGYDLAIMGVALPSIMADMALQPAAAGMLASTALVGMMIGNIGFGGLAERIGRRVTIVICLVLFSVFTALAGIAAEPFAFGASRFVAGLGIGGMMPNVVAQMTEYAPRRVRSTMVAVMFSGYALGGMLAALSGQLLIAVFGWRWVFVIAGAPLLLAPFVMRGMPESLAWLRRTGQVDALRRLAAELAPRGASVRMQPHAPASSADPVRADVRALRSAR